MNNWLYHILGIILILSGISIWLNPIIYSRVDMMIFDFSEIKIIVSLLFIIIGIAFIWTTLNINKKRK